jgi:hypothetical protein
MRNDKAIKLEELRAPGTRRVFEAIRMVSQEMSDFDEDDTLPKIPVGVLMKTRRGGGGRQHWE